MVPARCYSVIVLLLGCAHSPRGADAANGAQLRPKDVIDGVRANADSLGSCIRAAVSGAELAPGRHVFVIHFDILADGSIQRGRLRWPIEALRASLPDCFATKIVTWRFPASGQGASVPNFPVPVTITDDGVVRIDVPPWEEVQGPLPKIDFY